MNERIRELLKQATKTVDPENRVWVFSKVDQAKFADMIVQECADILMKPEYVMNHPEELTDYNRGWVNGRLLGIEHIREHFGVEE
jgi:hypothetical protein